MTTEEKSDGKPMRFRSLLERGSQRFLAHVIEHGLNSGRRSHEDFIRHFPPAVIMAGLKDRPSLRANLLVITTGIKSKIAEKKSWETAAEDLEIALAENEADAETVVMLFDPDDRVRYLDALKIWAFVVEGNFWEETKGIDFEIAKANIAFMLERALEDELVTHQGIVEGIGIDVLADKLPRAELAKVLRAALTRGREGKAFTDADALREAPSGLLVEHIPLPHIWTRVIEPYIARAHGYMDSKPVAPRSDEAADAPEHARRAPSVAPEAKASAGIEAKPAEPRTPSQLPEALGAEKPRRIPPPVPKPKLPPTGKPEDLPS